MNMFGTCTHLSEPLQDLGRGKHFFRTGTKIRSVAKKKKTAAGKSTYIFNSELRGFLLLDPLKQISSIAVLHNNAQEAVPWKHTTTFPFILSKDICTARSKKYSQPLNFFYILFRSTTNFDLFYLYFMV